jgi:hypothetical protein
LALSSDIVGSRRGANLISYVSIIRLWTTLEPTWVLDATRLLTIAMTVEVSLAFVATSLATLKPLIRLAVRKAGITSRQTSDPEAPDAIRRDEPTRLSTSVDRLSEATLSLPTDPHFDD